MFLNINRIEETLATNISIPDIARDRKELRNLSI